MGDDALMIAYHDDEYGVPVNDDNVIFERLMLEIYQAGLTWKLILHRRVGFNNAFHNYNLKKVATMTDKQLEALYDNPDIIRNKLKINTTRHNAQVALTLIAEHGSFLDYLRTLNYQQKGDPKEFFKPTIKQMKKDGFKFIGPLILEEFFKSIGMNEVLHQKHCFMYKK